MSKAAIGVHDAADPRKLLRSAAISRGQVIAIVVTAGLAGLDGYDVLAVTLAAPGIVRDWGIDHAALGVVLSSGLIGMAAGSFVLAPLADLIGRRTLVLACLGLMILGMGMSALAHGITELCVWRIITGLGVGAMIPVINPMATEFANERRRDLAVSTMAVGYPIGGVLGGSAAHLLLSRFDWPILFYIGAILGLLMVPVVLIWLPEPLSFLIERRRPDALVRANRLLARFGFEQIEALPPADPAPRGPLSSVLGPSGFIRTLRVTGLNLLFVVAVLYMLSWTPQLVADLGFSPPQAASVALLVNIAGIVGGIAFGWAAAHLGPKRLTLILFAGYAIAMVLFSFTPANLNLLYVAGTILGFFLFGGMCALHAVVSRSFLDRDRASGAGVVLGVGRAGSALSPLIAGLLFSFGIGRISVSFVMAIGVILAAILLAGHRDATPD